MWRVKIVVHLFNMLCSSCYPLYHSERDHASECMKSHASKLTREGHSQVVEYFVHFAGLKKSDQQNFLIQWIRYATASEALLAANKVFTKCLYVLSYFDFVCIFACKNKCEGP